MFHSGLCVGDCIALDDAKQILRHCSLTLLQSIINETSAWGRHPEYLQDGMTKEDFCTGDGQINECLGVSPRADSVPASYLAASHAIDTHSAAFKMAKLSLTAVPNCHQCFFPQRN